MQEYLAEKVSPTGVTTVLQSQNWILYYVQLFKKAKRQTGNKQEYVYIMWSSPPLFLLADKSQIEHHTPRKMMGFLKRLMQE